MRDALRRIPLRIARDLAVLTRPELVPEFNYEILKVLQLSGGATRKELRKLWSRTPKATPVNRIAYEKTLAMLVVSNHVNVYNEQGKKVEVTEAAISQAHWGRTGFLGNNELEINNHGAVEIWNLEDEGHNDEMTVEEILEMVDVTFRGLVYLLLILLPIGAVAVTNMVADLFEEEQLPELTPVAELDAETPSALSNVTVFGLSKTDVAGWMFACDEDDCSTAKRRRDGGYKLDDVGVVEPNFNGALSFTAETPSVHLCLADAPAVCQPFVRSDQPYVDKSGREFSVFIKGDFGPGSSEEVEVEAPDFASFGLRDGGSFIAVCPTAESGCSTGEMKSDGTFAVDGYPPIYFQESELTYRLSDPLTGWTGDSHNYLRVCFAHEGYASGEADNPNCSGPYGGDGTRFILAKERWIKYVPR